MKRSVIRGLKAFSAELIHKTWVGVAFPLGTLKQNMRDPAFQMVDEILEALRTTWDTPSFDRLRISRGSSGTGENTETPHTRRFDEFSPWSESEAGEQLVVHVMVSGHENV
jgi:hypothetical protein